MRFSKIILTATFLIGLFPFNRLYAQTLISTEVGVSMHNLELEEHTGSIVQSYQGLKNNFDFDISIDLKQYLIPKWFISLNSNIYIKNHTYSIHTLGINPRSDYTYRLFGYGLKTGVEIINNLEAGIGVSRTLLYDKKVIHSFMDDQKVGSSSLYCSTFFMSYKWNRFITTVSYFNSLPTSNMFSIDLFSIHLGYQWKVFEPIQRKSKVNCPKL